MRITQTMIKGLTVGLIFLFVMTDVIPPTAQKAEKKSSVPSLNGNILYVGGGGPGNYTKIQDAINDSNPGDTVYVYDDSSPYYEHLLIQKSIKLIGEDETTTEINGSSLNNSLDTVNITGDHVTLTDFHITDNHGYYYQAAIKVMGDYAIISNCTVSRNGWIGIYLYGASSCQLRDCDLYNNLVAINLEESRQNTIQNCSCLNNSDAITLYSSSDANHLISCTCKSNSFDSIHIQQSSDNQITGCICENGYDGISLAYAPNTTMHQNTMTNNYANFGIGSPYVSDYYCNIDTTNTINGKPIYYLIGQHDLVFDDTMNIGFLGLVSCHNISVKNLTFTNNFEGMLVADTSNALIENCSFYNNEGHGMYIISSSENTVSTCTFQNGFWDGIFLYGSVGNNLGNCSCTGSIAGVSLDSSTANIIRGMALSQCSVGISFDSSGGNSLKDNLMVHCGLKVAGGSLAEYINDADISNTVDAKPLYYWINETNRTLPSDAGQVILINCTDCNASHLNLSNASVGIELAYARGNTITHNTLDANTVVAIYLDGSNNDGNIINENLMRNNNYGIDIKASFNNVLQGNILSDNGLGFSFESSMRTTIVGNTIRNGVYGMNFDHSSLNTMTNNTIDNTSIFGVYLLSSSGNILKTNKMINCSLMVYGNTLAEYIDDVDTSNTVNGKPVYYYLHQTDALLPQDAGQVLLVDCSGCTVKNLNLDKGTVGIMLAYSSKNSIIGNMIQDQSEIAIDLGSAYNNNNTIQGNTLVGNGYGIDIEYSQGNSVKRNKVVSNNYGILLYDALNTAILRNTISKNLLGINVVESSGSTIRVNNIFKDYASGVSVEACSVTARWNWWGATTGPKGKGDRISVTNYGHVTYAPWLLFPVLFAGNIRVIIATHHQQNIADSPLITKGYSSVIVHLVISDIGGMCGLRNTRLNQEHIIRQGPQYSSISIYPHDSF